MGRCLVKNCETKCRPWLHFMYHRIPSPTTCPDRTKLWLLALNIDLNTPTEIIKKLRVCSEHFTQDDYYAKLQLRTRTMRSFLKDTAIPSIGIAQRGERETLPTMTVGEVSVVQQDQPEVVDASSLFAVDIAQPLVCEEEVLPEQQERSPSLGLEDPEPLQIKEEQQELWTSQEGEQLQGLKADINFTPTPVPVKSEHDEEKPQSSWFNQIQTEEKKEAEPLASTSTEQIKTEPGEYRNYGVSQPTTDVQVLSSDCSGTDDSDAWEATREPQSSLNTMKSKKTQKNKGQVVLSSDDDDEEADDARTGSVCPRSADSAHFSAALSWDRVEVAVNSTGEWEDITSEFSEDVNNTKIPLTRKRCMAVEFPPMEKKPKEAPRTCESIILECRSVRLGSLRRIQTPVAFSTDHIQLEIVDAENHALEKVRLPASELISCDWCNMRQLPVLFFQTTRGECLRLCTQLNMSQERGGPWYDCAGNQYNEKYIILILENGMSTKKQLILKNILVEIGKINNLNKFPTKLSLDETNIRLVNYNKATNKRDKKEKATLTSVTQGTPVSNVTQVTHVNPAIQPELTRMATLQAGFDDED